MVYEPGLSLSEVCKPELFTNVFKLQVFTSYRRHVAKYFKNPYLKSLLEFPVLFLGTAPSQTPALYSLMAYSGIKKGTFYPMGGFGKVIDAFKEICSEQGVEFHTNEAVKSVNIEDKTSLGIFILTPIKAPIEVATIGPRIQAKGKLK